MYVSLASKLKAVGYAQLAADILYVISGILLLVLLPLSNYPPHVALLGILSLITAYSTITQRSWAKWLIVTLFILATVFSLVIIFSIGLTNWLATLGLTVYVVLIWIFTAYQTVIKEEA